MIVRIVRSLYTLNHLILSLHRRIVLQVGPVEEKEEFVQTITCFLWADFYRKSFIRHMKQDGTPIFWLYFFIHKFLHQNQKYVSN